MKKLNEYEFRELLLTVDQVKFQLDQHGVINHDEFFEEIGHKSFFTGNEVLDWLGY